VPHGFRDILADANVLGTRVLWFERDGDGFSRPDQWDDATLATSSTHDLPTIAGWWAGRDIDWRIRLDLLGADETEAGLRRGREADRASLWQTLCDAGAAGGPLPGIGEAGHVIDAIAAFVGSTPCALAMLPLEDILGMVEQPNLPGTIDSHPNWRHRLSASVEHMMDEPHARARLEALAASRRRP
jgi:4-alpha-glucanotransferase